MELLLLANSVKNGGRCLAGLADDGTWIRPVSSDSGGAIPNGYALGPTPLTALDIVEFDLIAAMPLPYQAENVVIDPSSLRKVGRASIDDWRIARAAAEPAWFLSGWGRSIPADTYNETISAASLCYVEVEDFRAVRDWGKWRAKFTLGESIVDFPLTDDTLTSSLSGDTEPHPAGLCISVGERFQVDDSHYKLVAGVILR